MGSKPERGAYGNARGKPDKQLRRRVNRESDPRYQAAMAEVLANNAMIDKLADQPADQAALSNAARASIGLVYEKPDLTVQQPAEEPKSPRVMKGATMGRFVDCHCTHNKGCHENAKATPACVLCDCPGYRPITAPDPLAEIATSLKGEVATIILNGKQSERAATVRLALKVEGYLQQLTDLIEDEAAENAVRAAVEAKVREVADRVARLRMELEVATAELAEVKPKRKQTPRKVMKPPTKGAYTCPTCGDVRDTAQGRGAHRARAHGYRKGQDD